MLENPDHTYPDAPERVQVSAHANPSGFGMVVRQDSWTASVRMDNDGQVYLFGKNVIDPA